MASTAPRRSSRRGKARGRGRRLVIITTTLPSRRAATKLARALVTEGLGACAQVQGPVASTYRWKGVLHRTLEWYCHLKTTRARWPAARRRIAELHPYDVPEIVMVAGETTVGYGSWVVMGRES